MLIRVGNGEISPRQAVGGAVSSRATPPLQLETSFSTFLMQPENTFISAYLLVKEIEKSQVCFSGGLL